MRFETKIAMVVLAELPGWQKLNMTAFLASGVAGGCPDVMGEPYADGSGNAYLPMFRQPVLVFAASGEQLREVLQRARARRVKVAVFTAGLFLTGHDEANRAVVRAVPADKLPLAGLALYGRRNDVDKAVKGLALHP